MAVHFDFVMEDIDAENIVMAIRNSALRNDEQIMDYHARDDLTPDQKSVYIDWLKANKDYMLGLIEKMHNTRVE